MSTSEPVLQRTITPLPVRTAESPRNTAASVNRDTNGKRTRVNAKLIAAKGGGSYSVLDRRAPRGMLVRYWIQEVAADGSRSWHGPARVLRA